jgi:predicted transcriptional regulator YdeE
MPPYLAGMKTIRFACVLSILLPLASGASLQGQAGAPSSNSAQAAPAPVATEDETSMTVIGISVRTNNEKEASGNGEIPALWQRLMQQGLLDQISSRAPGGPVAVYSDYVKDEKSDYTYTVGARVTTADKVPDGFVVITVPAGRYAVVKTDQGPLPVIMPKAWQRIWALSPAELGGTRAFKVDYEIYPETMDPQNAQVEIHLGLK